MNKFEPLKIVLAVVDPEYPVKVDIDRLGKDEKLFKSTIKLAERNGLYYYFILRLKELGVDLPLSEEDRWKKENQKLSEFKETIKLLNNVSKEYGIEYIIIKECNTIPHIPRDIDIFVRNEDRTRIIKALEDNGMQCTRTEVTETSLEGKNYLKVDIYSRIIYLSIDIFDDGVIKSKMMAKIINTNLECFVLPTELDFILLSFHSLFGHMKISLLDFLHLMKVYREINSTICRKYIEEKGLEIAFNLFLEELNKINAKIVSGKDIIHFPYYFSQDFVITCAQNSTKLNALSKFILQFSLMTDKIVDRLPRTVYDILSSAGPIRKIYYYMKTIRGDKKI